LSFKNQKYDILFDKELDKMPKIKEKESLNSFDKYMIKKNNQKTIEIATNMLKKDYDIQSISEITGLAIKVVEDLKNNLK
jgi:hypothetical protein